jgi:hypothetical protein
MAFEQSITRSNGTFDIKGRGYSTRGAYRQAEGLYCLPMYRNRDDSSLGIHHIHASNKWLAFRIARNQCVAEMKV